MEATAEILRVLNQPLIAGLILALAGVIAGLVLNRKLESIRSDTSRALETIRHSFSKEQLRHQVRYQREFEIYEEMWVVLNELQWKARGLRPIVDSVPESEQDERQKRLDELAKSFAEAQKVINSQRPFYADEIYVLAGKLLQMALIESFDYRQGYRGKPHMEYWESARKASEKIDSLVNDILAAIRKRIGTSLVATGETKISP